MLESSAIGACMIATLAYARQNHRGRRALLRDRVLRFLAAHLVAARTAGRMT
jgi:hypothetical protein